MICTNWELSSAHAFRRPRARSAKSEVVVAPDHYHPICVDLSCALAKLVPMEQDCLHEKSYYLEEGKCTMSEAPSDEPEWPIMPEL